MDALRLRDTVLPASVDVALHALSLQENRKEFRPKLFTLAVGSNQVLKEVRERLRIGALIRSCIDCRLLVLVPGCAQRYRGVISAARTCRHFVVLDGGASVCVFLGAVGLTHAAGRDQKSLFVRSLL